MQSDRRLRALGTLFAATSLVAACGGGGSDAPPPPPPPPASIEISGKAVDGLLQGATACYDTNDNLVCDNGEPASSATGADGRFTIAVPTSQASGHRVIVDVPASAIDADTGQPVGSAFTLIAPGPTSAVNFTLIVSPLTTLVQQHADASGTTVPQSSDYIQSQLGLGVSPLSDFSASASAENARMANAAKLVLQAFLQQKAAVASAVGQTDVSGATISQAELERAVLDAVVTALPVIGAAAADAAVATLSGAAREQALTAAAATVVAGIGFTPEQARFWIGLPKIPQPQATTPQAGANMVALQYSNAANWFFRYNAATAADNTPDANGLTRYYSVRTRMAPYAYEPTQGVAESFARTTNPELHWSGTAWTGCAITDRSSQTPRDALGRSSNDFCNNFEKGTSQRGEIDISGQSLSSVWTNRLLVEQAKTNNPNAWSLPDVALLGNAVFPAGSRMLLQTNVTTETAPAYNTLDSNRVSVAPLAVTQGGDARSGSPACATDTSTALATSLEQLVERFVGQPCIFNQQTNDPNGPSLNPNEVWGNTTISLGTLATNVERPDGTANYYTTTRLLRASFPSAGNTLYWSCLQRTTNNGTRNCTQIGSGTYAIATRGDARVMMFGNLPTAAQGLGSTRVFVERNGAIYFGFKNRVGQQSSTVRLNMTAANAVLFQLQMPSIQPVDAPQPLTGAKAANAATLTGVWALFDAGGAAVLRFGPNGEYLMAQTSAPDGGGRPGVEQGFLDVDLAADRQLGVVLNVDSNDQWGFSHPIPNDRISSITATAITLGDGTVISRLPNVPNGIVGMWSPAPADFKAPHFVFLPDGKVVSIQPYAETEGSCATARQGPPGIESGPYTFDAATGALSIGPRTIDSTGCTGLWEGGLDPAGALFTSTVTFAADGQSAVFTLPEGGTTTLFRVTVQ